MRRIRYLAIFLILFAAVIAAANIDVSIRQGVDGRLRYIHMPLYVKWTQFLARHYEYGRLAKEITSNCRTDEEKALAILEWTHDNIRELPAGAPVIDDHVLNIVIRGYAVPEQFQDVFTTLCSYAGLPAFLEKFYDKERKARNFVSLVKINGKWRVFDAFHGKYFRKDDGEIASVEDIVNDPSLVRGEEVDNIVINGVPYKDLYYSIDLRQVRDGVTLRPYRQMPLHRIIYELKKAFGIEKEEAINPLR